MLNLNTKSMKVKEIIKIIEADGWFIKRFRGSYRQFKHGTKPGVVTVPGNLNDELAVGTCKSIYKQAGIDK